MRNRVQECWNTCFGEESVLFRVQSFDLFVPLFDNLEFEIVEDDQFDALARRDGLDGCAISLTTGTQAFLQPVFDEALTLLAHKDSRPWRLLGWPRRHFGNIAETAQRLSEISLDFIGLHEFAHVIWAMSTTWPVMPSAYSSPKLACRSSAPRRVPLTRPPLCPASTDAR